MLYAKKINLNNKNDSLSQIYNLVTDSSRVLDVGCACGGLATALKKKKNCVIYGLEYNPKSVEICKKLKVFEKVWHYDLNGFKQEDFPQYKKFFDVIICADVLEHLIFPEQFLSKVQMLLKEEGKIIISLPNVAHASIKANLLLNDFSYTQMGILDKTHLHFYTYKSIAEFLSAANLKIIKANFVMLPLDGWQPHKIDELPKDVAKFITRDKHSAVMQYITECIVQKCPVRKNIEMLNSINVTTLKNSMMSKMKRLLMTKYPKIIKYVERFK